MSNPHTCMLLHMLRPAQTQRYMSICWRGQEAYMSTRPPHCSIRCLPPSASYPKLFSLSLDTTISDGLISSRIPMLPSFPHLPILQIRFPSDDSLVMVEIVRAFQYLKKLRLIEGPATAVRIPFPRMCRSESADYACLSHPFPIYPCRVLGKSQSSAGISPSAACRTSSLCL